MRPRHQSNNRFWQVTYSMFQCALYWQYMYIYNGYKNLSTYLSYTAGFLQAQELSELLKPLKMVQLHLPGFQDFALPENVCMWKALANQQWSCRHTHTNVSTLFEIYKYFFNRSKSLSEQSKPLCYTYGRHSLVSTPVTYSMCQYAMSWNFPKLSQGTTAATAGTGRAVEDASSWIPGLCSSQALHVNSSGASMVAM